MRKHESPSEDRLLRNRLNGGSVFGGESCARTVRVSNAVSLKRDRPELRSENVPGPDYDKIDREPVGWETKGGSTVKGL